jgi:cobalt/nickel transport system permease protein
MNKTIRQITELEDLAHKNSPVHRLAPSVKLIITVIFVITIISFRPQEIGGLILFASFPAFVMIIGEIPLKPLLFRCMIALPFALAAGISNLFLDRDLLFTIGDVGVTGGMLSFTALILKTVLTVMSVMILVSTTGMNDLIYGLLSLHIPSVIIIQIMMTYRYLKVLMEEAALMYHAYLLRAPREKGIRLRDMGPFLGQLILRSFDRAERIYQAMLCRGFEGNMTFSKSKKLLVSEWIIIICAAAIMITLRLIHLEHILGTWIL